VISNGYCDLAQFKVRASLPAGGAHDDDVDRAIEAASRAIDEWCCRRFYADSTVSARYYTAGPEETYVLAVDDISTTTGLIVRTDDDWNGTYENTWTLNSRTGPWGFMVEPTNWSALSKPITRLRAVADVWPTVEQGVEVTAKWGWASIPVAITEACLMLAVRYWKRKDTPFGVMGTSETGFVTLPKVDPDVQALLNPYRRMN
jgi:hypothetical protein